VLKTAAVDRTPEALRQGLAALLEKSVGQQQDAFAAGVVRRFITLTLQFHRRIVEAGGSGVLLELYDRLSN
jgi:DNA-binding GntR family transcriptional regulator